MTLAKYLKKAGKKLTEASEEVGKTALGGASLGAKKAGKVIEGNPKTAAATAAALGYAAGSDGDDKKKKRKPEYLD